MALILFIMHLIQDADKDTGEHDEHFVAPSGSVHLIPEYSHCAAAAAAVAVANAAAAAAAAG